MAQFGARLSALAALVCSSIALSLLAPVAAQPLPCPAVGATGTARLNNVSYLQVATYFAEGVFDSFATSNLDRCKMRALEDACELANAGQVAFFLYSSSMITSNPVSFEPSNCLAGYGCAASSLSSIAPTSAGVDVTYGAVACTGCAGTRFARARAARGSCPKGAKREKREWCPGGKDWVCACHRGEEVEVRNKSGQLIKCKDPRQLQ